MHLALCKLAQKFKKQDAITITWLMNRIFQRVKLKLSLIFSRIKLATKNKKSSSMKRTPCKILTLHISHVAFVLTNSTQLRLFIPHVVFEQVKLTKAL